MDLFAVFAYVCMAFLVFDLGYLIVKTKCRGANTTVVLINSLFCVIISNLSIWQDGIYLDEYNLSGSGLSFLINIVNIIIFIVMIFIVTKGNRTEKS